MTYAIHPLSVVSIVIGSLLLTANAYARDFSGSNIGRYGDGPWDIKTNVAVSVLTDQDVLRGNADGTFRANALLNRAEFITIVMRLAGHSSMADSCFPDVSANDWYAADVCAAKAAGYIRGNAQAGVSPERWRFEPTRSIQYEEALKILTEIFDIPVSGSTEGAQWYQPYVQSSQEFGIELTALRPGETITRGEIARLAVAYQAYAEGELDALRTAEAGVSSSRSSRSSSRSSVSSSSLSSLSSFASSQSSKYSSIAVDPMTDTSARGAIAVLGGMTHVLAGTKFFSNTEPFLVTQIDIEMFMHVQSLPIIRVYDSTGRLLGNAVRGSAFDAPYTLNLSSGTFSLPHKKDTSIYFRGVLDAYQNGAVSGEKIQIWKVTLHGTGEWNKGEYSVSTSVVDTFPVSETARAVITGIKNTGADNASLAPGTSQLLAQFQLNAKEGDSQAQVRITAMDLDIEGTGVTLSNVHLRAEGGDEIGTCTNSSTVITCTSIPSSIGVVDLQKTIRVYGDVTVASNVSSPSLRIVMSDFGSSGTGGDIDWTDGTTLFDWLSIDTPVVRGTLLK